MVGCRGLIFLALAVPVAARFLRAQASLHAVSVQEHSIVGVIKLLKGLSAQVKEEAESETLLYQKFEYWCANSQKKLDTTIAAEKEHIESLSEKIESHEAAIDAFAGEIAELSTQIDDLNDASTEADKADGAREKLYNAESASYQGTIEAIQDAITLLESAKSETDASLIQHRLRNIVALVGMSASTSEQSMLESFSFDPSPERPTLKAEGDYTKHVDEYKFKSYNVIELLKALKSKFKARALESEKAETNSVNAYNLAKQSRKELLTAAQSSKGVKEEAKGEEESALGAARLAKVDVQSDLKADADTLDTTHKACQVKASEWSERSRTRSNEKEAIETAIAVLAKVSGVRTEAPSNPVLPQSPVLIQLGMMQPGARQAVELLRHEAHIMHSSALEALSQAVAASSPGHFNSVINSIEKMIFQLMKEQTDENNQKDWCDQELSKTETSITDKKQKVSDLEAKINVAVASIQSLAIDIADANDKASEVDQHMRESAEIRKIGKEENSVALKDAEDAQTALTQAIAVLKDFYKDSGAIQKESWEFIQRSREPVSLPANPRTWDAPYTGVADPQNQPNGIITLLEGVLAQFASMESNTRAQEESDQSAFEDDMSSCKIEKARASKEAQVKDQEKKRLVEQKGSYQTAKKGVSHELDAAEQYKLDLRPACVDGSSSYKDRKAARSQEIEALRQAQDILQDAFKSNSSDVSQ